MPRLLRPPPLVVRPADWLYMQAARIEGAKPPEERSQHFQPIMETLGNNSRQAPDETGAAEWQRELRKARMDNLQSMAVHPQRLLTYVAGRPMAVLPKGY